ncbi:MAG: hypothetical protein AVDCRST_MAG71-2184, partial [uncultured Lysobacter sp.]
VLDSRSAAQVGSRTPSRPGAAVVRRARAQRADRRTPGQAEGMVAGSSCSRAAGGARMVAHGTCNCADQRRRPARCRSGRRGDAGSGSADRCTRLAATRSASAAAGGNGLAPGRNPATGHSACASAVHGRSATASIRGACCRACGFDRVCASSHPAYGAGSGRGRREPAADAGRSAGTARKFAGCIAAACRPVDRRARNAAAFAHEHAPVGAGRCGPFRHPRRLPHGRRRPRRRSGDRRDHAGWRGPGMAGPTRQSAGPL